MQFNDVWSALRRRWYLVLVVLVVAAVGCFGIVRYVGPTYESQGAVLLLPPGSADQRTSGGTIGNPFLSLAGVSQARDVVIRTLTSKTTLQELCRASSDPAYEAMRTQLCDASPPGVSFDVTPDFTSSAPIIVITVDADSPANGTVALQAVAARVPVILADLQAGLELRDRALIKSIPVVLDTEPDVVYKTQIRAGIVAAGGLLGIGLLAIALIDSALVGRRRGGSQAADERDAPEPIVEDRDETEVPGWGWDGAEATGSADAAEAVVDEPAVAVEDEPDPDDDDQDHAVFDLNRKRRVVSDWSSSSSSSG